MTAETTTPMKTVQAEATPVREETRPTDRSITPRVDIVENKEGLRVVAELPGAAAESVEVSVDNGVLTLRGIVETTWKGELAYQEWGGAQYFRQFTVGQRIDQSRIQADFKHGLLTVVLPFAESTKPRQIAVKVA